MERTDTGRTEITFDDPEGPVPPPTIPADLAARAKTQPSLPPPDPQNAMTYSIDCLINGKPARTTTFRGRGGKASGASGPMADHAGEEPGAPEPEADNAAVHSELVDTFQKTSTLHRLKDTPPNSLTGLERRLAVALKEGREILDSYGYYAGRITGRVERAAQDSRPGTRARVHVMFMPGPRYRVGKTTVTAHVSESLRGSAPEAVQKLPRTLADAGLEKDAPARAKDILAAVDRAHEVFLDNGFPFAAIASARYFVNHDTQTLETELRINPGEFVRMGDIEHQGEVAVKDSYLQNMRVWSRGRPWDRSRIETLREKLRGSGLFQSIDITPGKNKDAFGNHPVVLDLKAAPERTISAVVKYHSDFGPGLQANWEHRNLTGRGDSLRLTLPLWLDMQELTASYRLPFFMRRDQDFIAGGGALNQDTDAYRVASGAFSAGIERRFSRWWHGFAKGSVEGGSIKEAHEPKREYLMLGLPLGLVYDNTGSKLDAVRGQRVIWTLTPHTGTYDRHFNAIRTRVEAHAFMPLAGQDTLVLALKGVAGAIAGEESAAVPPSIRFYSGGGGSVRGYKYQSIGPRSAKDKPLGGGSVAEVNAEARYKFTPEWGVVAFVDGGAVYDDIFADAGRAMRFGAGIGLRCYTVAGPVRADLATPLNPRDSDASLQFYLSIGQNF